MRTKHTTTLCKRLGAWALTLALVVGLLPQTAFAADTVSYLDYNNGTWTTEQVTNYTEIKSGSTPTSWSGSTNGGWYVVTGSVTINSRINVSGNVKLILNDGCSLTAPKGITVTGNNSLTIYAQSTGDNMGKLSATGAASDYSTLFSAGIGGYCSSTMSNRHCGTITINGGNITATGGSGRNGGAGIGGAYRGAGGTITINGGVVVATGNSGGSGIGGGDAKGGGVGAGGTVTITGGHVTASSDAGRGIGSGRQSGSSSTFSTGTNGTAIIYARSNSYAAIHDTSKQSNWSGIIFQAQGSGTAYSGTVYGDPTLKENLEIANDQTLTIPEDASLTIPNGVILTVNGALTLNGSLKGEGTISPEIARPKPTIQITADLDKDYDGETVSLNSSGYTYNGNATPEITWHSDSGGNIGSQLDNDAAPAEPGTYWVKVFAAATGMCQAADAATKQFTITPTYTVTVQKEGSGSAGADTSRAREGADVILSATPSEGYHFKEWQVTPNTVSIGENNKFTMPAENVAITAVFEAHNYNQQVVSDTYKESDATCTEAAKYHYSCSCGAKGTETFTSGNPTGHTPGADWKHDNGSTHWKLCENCGAKVEETAHVYDNEQDIICNDCGYVKPTYAISASPGTLGFGSETEGYADAPAAQIVTITNIGNQSVTVNLPTSATYTITAGTGFEDGTATLASEGTATFTVQPNTGLDVGSHDDTLNISGSNGTSASVKLSFTVNAVYTLTVNLNGGSGSTTGGQYPAGKVVNIDAGSRSNYRFTGWTTSNGGSFADASSASTTFTMPAADTTITANWQYNGGGGGSSRPSTPSTPTGPATGESGGWEEIGDEIGEAQPGETIVVDMNGTTEVPAEIFEEVAGKDVTVEFDLGGGISWTVNGTDVPTGTSFQSLNLGVDMGTSGISVNVINNITGEYGSVQVTLAHDGEFGFALTLTAPLGSDNAGHWANLYYYHEDSEALTFQTSGRIGADGSVSLRFTHASQYAIVIDDYSHEMPFEDVGEGVWYYDAVSYVYAKGLMGGTSATTFEPNTTTSRAMIAVILWRLEGSPIVEEYTDFSDVADGAWYTEGIRWASSVGVVGGYPNGSFGPDDPITREQMAAMLYRYADYKGWDVTELADLSAFTDAESISGYAVTALRWANAAGIVGGYNDSTLRPQGNARRSEAAAMLQRFCEAYIDSEE